MQLKIIFLILFLIISSIVFFINDMHKEREISRELIASTNKVKANYNTIIDNFKLDSKAMKETMLEFPEFKQILTQTYYMDDEEKQKYRKHLYEILEKDFKTFKKMGVKLILITDKNNKVFLRMHKPDKYSDDISKVRFAVARVNATQEEMFGFEQGKISHAYRHIYPIYNDQQQYIGNIDISFSSEGIQKSMDDVHRIHTHFLVNKKIIDTRVWKVKGLSSPYKQSFENEDFMISFRNKCSSNMGVAQKVVNNNREEISSQMKNLKKFAVYGEYENDHVVVSFLPIYSVMNKEKASAYLVSYTHNIQIAQIINEYVLTRIVALFIIFLVLFIMYYMILKRKEFQLTSKVFSTMNDGVLITDKENTIIRANDAFSEMTQFSKEELLGRKPSYIRSKWHKEEFYKSLWKGLNANGYWQGEIINRKKDGSVFTADTSIYILKDNLGSVTNYIAISNDITQRKEKDSQIHELAYYDVLTKLPNKTYFHNVFTNQIKTAKRHGNKLALMFIDLDNFKSINDTHGHLVGDGFLKEAANRMKSVIRESDVVSRFGGDEFVIMVDDFTALKDISILCEKIILAFEKSFFIHDIEVYSGASIGVSIYPDNALTYEELLRTADTAMYQIKHNGKNGYKFFSDSMDEELADRMKIEHELRTAMESNEFYVTYQPKVDTVAHRVYGMETLLRWENNNIGFIAPDIFIPITEENGMIYELGLWVIKQAIRDTIELHAEGEKLIVSVNVSGVQLENESFIQDLSSVIDEFKFDEKYLELEITETQLMRKIDVVQEKLQYLSSRGIKISIDDFGTGYSSLSHLKRLPADTIKIDRSFVLDIEENEEDKELISSIVQIAKVFDMDVVAEGSETQESIEKLKVLGCVKVQGYYFSKPLKFFAFKEFLARYKHKSEKK